MVTSDQRSLDSGQKGSVIAEKAYEGFRKGLLEGLAGGGKATSARTRFLKMLLEMAAGLDGPRVRAGAVGRGAEPCGWRQLGEPQVRLCIEQREKTPAVSRD